MTAVDLTMGDKRRRPRVRVLFCACGHRGGSVKQLHDLLRTLDRRRFHAGFISYYGDELAARLFQVSDVFCRYRLWWTTSPMPDVMKPIGRFFIPTPFALQYLLRALWALVIHRPHVIYLNNNPAQHLPVIWLARWIGLPVICHLRAARPLTKLDWYGIPYISRFVAISEAVKTRCAGEGVDHAKIRVAYNVMRLGEFDRACSSGDSHSLQDDAIYAVQVASLGSVKRPMLAVMGFELAKRLCSNLKLVLIGEGLERARIEEYLKRRNLSSDVLLMGQRADVPAILGQCHIGLLLSVEEGLGNVVLEYMGARLPVVVTRIASIDEMVVRDETAIVLEKAEPKAVAAALIKLYRSGNLRQRMGDAGRRKLEASPFVRGELAQKVGRVIDEVAQK